MRDRQSPESFAWRWRGMTVVSTVLTRGCVLAVVLLGFAFTASSRVRLSTTEVTILPLSKIMCVFGQTRLDYWRLVLGSAERGWDDRNVHQIEFGCGQECKGGGNGGSTCINGLNASRQTSGNLKNRPQPSEKLPGSFTEPNTSLSCSRPRTEEEKQFSDGTRRIACWTRTY